MSTMKAANVGQLLRNRWPIRLSWDALQKRPGKFQKRSDGNSEPE